jgi:molybdenum cofactor biosynthesis enzyme MoaA
MTFPTVELRQLDELWFQITGTRCNLRCTHCFISCAPDNTTFGYLDAATVRRYLEESARHGVKEYYFTGGEPFLHPEMIDILESTLAFGPATVLTNGTIMTEPMVRRLAAIRDASIYSLELRISIDHFDEAKNDAIRGEGSYRKAMNGAQRLAEAGFLPIVTAMRTWEIDEDLAVIDQMSRVLREAGLARPRIKFLPALKIGAEVERAGGYGRTEFVTEAMMDGFPQEQLICSHSRIVTDRGVHVCPILIEANDSILGSTLEEASRGFTLRHQACSTCYLFGSICTNPTSVSRETSVAPGRRK